MRRWLAIAAGAGLVWLSLVALAGFTRPDEPAAAPAPTVAATATASPLRTETVEPTTTAAASEPTAGPVALPADVQVERLTRQFSRRQVNPVVAYRSAQGVVLVELGTGTAHVVEPPSTEEDVNVTVEDRLAELSEDEVLFGSAGEVFAIDRVNLDVRVVADDASLVVAESVTGGRHWVSGGSLQLHAARVTAWHDGEVAEFGAPTGAELLVADGLGLLAVSRLDDGPTMIASPDGFEPLSERRVIDANPVGLLERCQPSEGCQLQVRYLSPRAPDGPGLGAGDVWELPTDFAEVGDRFELAPDATAVLRYTERGFAEIYSADRSETWVTGSAMADAAWSDDSDFVVWIDPLGTPELALVLLDERDWLSLDLSTYDLPRPLGTDIAVFESAMSR